MRLTKKIIFGLAIVSSLVFPKTGSAQTDISGGYLVIGSGAQFVTSGTYDDLEINAGATVSLTGTLNVAGDITNAGTLTLNTGLDVAGSLTVESDIDLNGQTIDLGGTGTLVENAGRIYGTTGDITATRSLSGITDEDVAGLGAVITTAANMGSTVITRSHAQAGGNLDASILRQYVITPTTNTGLNATLVFNYLDDELNSLTEANFDLAKSTDDGTTWTFQDGTVSTGDNTVTLTGIDAFSSWTVAETFTQSTSNYALNFDGTDDYVNCGTINLSGSTLTLECWVNADNFTNPGQGVISLFGTEQSGNAAFMRLGDLGGTGQALNKVQFVLIISGSEAKLDADLELSANTWYHIAGVYDASSGMKIYINGVLDASNSQSGSFTSNDLFYIGINKTTDTRFIDGSMDEVRVWNTARTATHIRENMCRTLDGDETGLVAYYKLDETSGTTASDETGNYDGTWNGAGGGTTTPGWTDSEAFTTWLGGTDSDWSTAANWTDDVPTSTDNAGIYLWSGGSEATISGSPEVNNLIISSTASPTLSSGITINGSLILESDMDLNGQTVTLGSSAMLVEDAGVFSGTTGSITTTRSLSNIDEDVAGLGAEITTTADMGSTTITRSHAEATGNINASILRQYEITPTTNTGLSATLVFNYLDDELNSLTEANLQLMKSENNGVSWSEEGGTVSTGDNTVTLSGIDGFSTWTLAEEVTQSIDNYELDFDGTDDYVTLPSSLYTANLSGGTAITIEYWFKGTVLYSPVRFQNEGYIVAGWSDPPLFIISSDGSTSGVEIGTDAEIEDGDWHHIACVWEANTTNGFRTYLDGVLKNQRTSADVTLPTISSGLYLGAYSGGEYLTGSLDEVRIWSTARTATQIRENMTRTLDGDETGLVAYYRLNETSGTTASDATGNGYNATLTNMDESSDWTDSEAFTTWLGGTSSDWSTAANWTDGVPTSSDNVGIYAWSGGNNATISGSPEVNNLVISSTASPTISSGITVNGSLILESDMDLNGQTVTLGSSAMLVEDAGVFSGTTGSITTTRSLSNIDEDVAGLGAEITTTADMGSTTITRSHAEAGGNLSTSILRKYAITPTTNTGLSATLVFNYLDGELNGLTEDDLDLVKSTDGGTTWTFQSGTVSTSDNTITLTGLDGFSSWSAAETITQSTSNYALDFDGTDDYVSINLNSSSSNTLTIESWVKFTSLTNQQNMFYIAQYVGANCRFVPYKDASNEINLFVADASSNADVLTSGITVSQDTWYHLCFIYDNQNASIYINGKLIASEALDYAFSLDGADVAHLGSDNGGLYSTICLDEVRIWNTARTQLEITENMMRTLDGDETGLIAYYKLDETSGTTASDATSYGNDGTLTNMDGGTDWIDSDAFTTWLGGTSTDWATAGNWSDGVPATGSNVGIYKWNSGNEADINTSLTFNNVVASSTATPVQSSSLTTSGNLFINNASTYSSALTVGGDLVVNGNASLSATNTSAITGNVNIGTGSTFTIKPNSKLTVTGTMTNNGAVAIESPSDSTNSGSLITNGTLTNNGTMTIGRWVPPGVTGNKVYHSMGLPVANTTAGTYFTGDYVYEYEESDNSWTNIINADSSIYRGKGYLVKTTGSAKTYTFSGTFNTGDYTYTLYNTDQDATTGYNFISNPYPSPIDLEEITRSAEMGNTVWVWDRTNYLSYQIGNTGTLSQYILPCQAFFIKVSTGNASGTVTFNNDDRTHTTTDATFRSLSEKNSELFLEVSNGDLSDVLMVTNKDFANDGYKLFTWVADVPQIYAMDNNKEFCIYNIPDAEDDYILPVEIMGYVEGQFTIKAIRNSFTESIILRDKLTGQEWDVSDIEEISYEHTTANEAREFELVFASSASGANVHQNNTEIKIFNDNTDVVVKTTKTGGVIKVYDINGRLVVSQQITSTYNRLNMQTNGIYLVQVITNERSITEKIIVNK